MAPYTQTPCTVLSFRPIGSTAVCSGPTGGRGFQPDLEGDYLADSSTRWRAMKLPPKMGQSDPLRFADKFRREQKPMGDAMHTDAMFEGWTVAGKPGGDVQTGSQHGLELSGGSIETADLLPSIFSEPLTLTLSSIHLTGPQSNLTATFGELVLHVGGGSTMGASVSAAGAGTPILHATLASNKCGAAGATATLNANSVNVTLALSCAGASAGDPKLWDAQGVPHGAVCKDSPHDDCGHSTLVLAGGTASLRSVSLRSNLVAGNDPLRPSVIVPALPAVLAGITDEVGFRSPDLGKLQPRNQDGILDVSLPPFSADKTGAKDATAAIQAAVDYAREHYQVVFFPEGTYTVSDTIVVRAVPRAMATGHVPGPLPGKGATNDFLLDGVSSRYVPNYLIGSRLGKGATIVLKPKTPGFIDASKPAYVLDFFFMNSAEIPEPNAQYNSMATSLSIDIGSGNVGAVGIRLRGAQGSGIEDVTVFAGDGLAGIVGGCGSGGAHHGLRVVGGRYGLDLRQSQPTGTVSGSTLEGQRCAGLIYGGFESLSAVGMNITGQRGCFGAVSTAMTGAGGNTTYYLPGAPRDECSLPLMPTGPGFPSDYQQSNPGIVAKMSFIDSVIDFAPARSYTCPTNLGGVAAFRAVRSLFLQNIYVANADTLYSMDVDGKSDLKAISGPTLVKRLVYAIDPPAAVLDPNAAQLSVQLHAAVYIDGVRQTSNKVVDIAPAASAPPADLQSRHLWPAGSSHPSFESDDCVNVKALATPAHGDGATDDYQVLQGALDAHSCVFLPRGVYLTSRTLQVHPGRALVGVAKHLTRITSVHTGLTAPPRHPNPLRALDVAVLPVVEVLPTVSALGGAVGTNTVLAFISISVWNTLNTTSALHFHADDGIYRQVHANRANRCGSLYRPGCVDSVRIDYPLQMVQGAQRLKVYTFFEEDCCHEHVTDVSRMAKNKQAGVPSCRRDYYFADTPSPLLNTEKERGIQ